MYFWHWFAAVIPSLPAEGGRSEESRWSFEQTDRAPGPNPLADQESVHPKAAGNQDLLGLLLPLSDLRQSDRQRRPAQSFHKCRMLRVEIAD
jgi:hypothetical protein